MKTREEEGFLMAKIKRREFLKVGGAMPMALFFNDMINNDKTSGLKAKDLIDPWIEIDSQRVVHNIRQIRKRIGKRPIMGVIKANAYGHGLIEFARLIKAQQVKCLAVGKVEEAVSLRENGLKGIILNLGPFSKYGADQIVRHGLSQSAYSPAVDILNRTALKMKQKVAVHIKIDTGLGRVGVPYHRALPFLKKVAAMTNIEIEGIFTTLTEDKEFDALQLKRFLNICKQAERAGISVGIRHAAASAAVANFPPSFLDMVRPGNCMYGIEPLANLDLKPVMSLKTRVIYVKKLRAGDAVSYHRKFVAKKETLLASLPIGYSDGYPHNVIKKAHVLIKGEVCPLVAAVTSNHVTVDVTGLKGVKTGDEVVLIGNQGRGEITYNDVAKWANSSVYKVAIAMNTDLPRLYS